MKWNPSLTEATLIKRYKRFLADIKLKNQNLTIHVPNTGAMTSCWEAECVCGISKSDNPSRKMAYTLEYTRMENTWIGVNTANANKVMLEWLKEKILPEFSGYEMIQPEKKIGDSRIDFFLSSHSDLPDCYIEVKSVTLKLQGVAQFPDSVSERGQKHLKELIELKKQGKRACMAFVVQREDVDRMKAAYSIDRKYTELIKEANAAGVEIYVYQCRLNLTDISFGKRLPFDLE